jgi:hypothetical protein
MSDCLTMTVGACAKYIGFHRSVVTVLMNRGEIEYVPAVRPDGTRSRVHRKPVKASAEAWVRKNTVRCPEDLKRVVDGRRR